MKDYGNAIKTLRKRSMMTQTTLAEKLNVSGQAVSKWENNLAQPDLDTVVKMTEIFGITMNEFTELCSSADFDVDADAQDGALARTEDSAEEKANAAPPILIGVCSECGTSIYNEENIGERTPKLICNSCKEARIRRARAEADTRKAVEAHRRREVKSSFVRATVVPAIVIGAIALLLAIVCLVGGGEDRWWLLGIVFGLAAVVYMMVVQICWDSEGVVGEVFFWSVTKSFRMPGLIFTLDLDGLIWFITVKIGLAILSFLLSVAVAILGIAFCLIISPLTFLFSLMSNIARVKRGEAA